MQRAVMCDIIICIYMYASDVAEPATTDRDTYTCVMLCIAVATFSYHKLICYCGYVLDNLCVSIKIYCRIRHYYRRLPSSSVCKLQRKLGTFSWNRNRSFIGWFWHFPSAVFVYSPRRGIYVCPSFALCASSDTFILDSYFFSLYHQLKCMFRLFQKIRVLTHGYCFGKCTNCLLTTAQRFLAYKKKIRFIKKYIIWWVCSILLSRK